MAKAMSEHLAHATAARLRRPIIRILGGPHTFTHNRGDNTTKKDDPHITASSGAYTVHIYLDNYLSSSDEYNWDNVRVKSQYVVARGIFRADMSYGSMTGQRDGSTSSYMSTTDSGSYYITAPATTATYGATGSATRTAGATTGVGQWQLHKMHN